MSEDDPCISPVWVQLQCENAFTCGDGGFGGFCPPTVQGVSELLASLKREAKAGGYRLRPRVLCPACSRAH